jgi:hypothetical protein
MLKNQMENVLTNMVNGGKLEIYKEEKGYVEKHGLIEGNITLIEKEADSRFSDAYIERSDKETEEVIGVEGQAFLNQPINYFKKHMNEFLYLESNWFEIIGVDAVSLEVDDVFRTYDVMLGLKFQKKYDKSIKEYLKEELSDEAKFDLMFSADEGIWSLNFDLDSVEGFHEEMTIGEGYRLIYQFLFKLAEAVEAGK